MKKLLGLLLVIIGTISYTYGQIEKVELDFKQDEVYVIVDETLMGMSPDMVKVNFDLNKNIYFYKKGYYSQKLVIDPFKQFAKLTIDLNKKPESTKLDEKQLLKLDTLLVSKIVTNFTSNDLKEILENNFLKNNFLLGKDIALFQTAESDIKNTKYKIGIEIVDSDQYRSVYKAPRFMMAQIKIRWSLFDTDLNKVVYFNETEGAYFVKIQKSKGLVVSELMRRVMEGAIDEAQTKLFADKKFNTCFLGE